MVHEEEITESVAVSNAVKLQVGLAMTESAALEKIPDYSTGYGVVTYGNNLRNAD